MARKLFCEISPLTYKISVIKCCTVRHMRNLLDGKKFATSKPKEQLPILVYKHNSLIRRKLGNVDLQLQENKATNLAIATPKVSGIVIKPGEIFSFWKLVGLYTKRKGYKEGLTISSGKSHRGIGGGMCQFTNLIHWLVLHSPLDIIEHHHHDGYDLFPDYGRQVPFGTGTSIYYNYLDYRFVNNTEQAFQLIVYTTDTHLCGELRTTNVLDTKYHIRAHNEAFVREGDDVYRIGEIYRECVDKASGEVLESKLIKTNHALVMYDTDLIEEITTQI